MIRAAAKNHRDVAVVVDGRDYAAVLADLDAHEGAVTLDVRRRLAQKAYARTAAYDARISNWLAAAIGEPTPAVSGRSAAPRGGDALRREPASVRRLLPHAGEPPGVATARQVQGKQLSYNNINDTDAAFECVAEFARARAAVAIVKHANPCGVAEGRPSREPTRRPCAAIRSRPSAASWR